MKKILKYGKIYVIITNVVRYCEQKGLIMNIKIVALSAFSVSFELDELIPNEVHPFYSKNKFDVYLNDK